MKRFVWRLQRVLDVKEKAEQIKRSELFKLTEQLAEIRTVLLYEKRILKETMTAVKEGQTNQRLSDQALFLKHTHVNDERIKHLQQQIAELEKRQQKMVQEVMELRHARKRLEQLKERAKDRYIREYHKTEQKELDDRATVAYVRKGT